MRDIGFAAFNVHDDQAAVLPIDDQLSTTRLRQAIERDAQSLPRMPRQQKYRTDSDRVRLYFEHGVWPERYYYD
jgi:hypothetical protein